jgi:hypothetical protein
MISRRLTFPGLPRHIPPMQTKNRKYARRRIVKLLPAVVALLGGWGATARPASASQLKATTVEAFEQYVRSSEARMSQELAGGNNFLWIDALPEPARSEAYARLRQGQVITERLSGRASHEANSVPGGLIHDWVGIVFIPGTSMPQALALLQDYDRDAMYYRPEVLQSKLLERSGDNFRVFLRLRRVRVVTVVFDTEYDVRYTRRDAAHAWSRSYSTRIAEVDDAGTPREHDRPAGDDRGFLWRLYTYWRFLEADGGTYVQCNAISLTRDIPTGLGWLVRPFIEDIPVESLRFTLNATRTALVQRHSSQLAPSRDAEVRP